MQAKHLVDSLEVDKGKLTGEANLRNTFSGLALSWCFPSVPVHKKLDLQRSKTSGKHLFLTYIALGVKEDKASSLGQNYDELYPEFYN